MKFKSILQLILICVMFVACRTQQSLKPVSVANLFPEEGLTDPHTLIDNNRIYVFCGHDQSWETNDTWRMDRWEIRSSDNLIDWVKEGVILPTQTYIGDKPNCWAGDIIKHKGKYYWYFSNRNINTGVMVSDSPTGPFVDALGKPLLPRGLVKTASYDPEIFQENNINYIIFGIGEYYMAQLNDDCISLAEEPKPISIVAESGEKVRTEDKPAMFKQNSWYYLLWGAHYAMSKTLYGPYIYKGAFLKGGHNNVFQWKNKWYAVMENKDISLFYRGVSLKPLSFNKDGTVKIPKNDDDFPAEGRKWTFEKSTMAWNAVRGTSLEWDENGYIKGEISGQAMIESAYWLLTKLDEHQTLVLRLKNKTDATQAKISIASLNPQGAFWKTETTWEEQDSVFIDLQPNNTNFQEFKIDLSTLPNIKKMLVALRIEPAIGVTKGSWEIDYISVE